ncbi:MAG: hypothetical protein KDI44_11155 [Thiothrix sp.]|nr:hypothetical protein [Thiothrix sp.]HPQ95966.1 hypothetical protein [Thiolinea sp.]
MLKLLSFLLKTVVPLAILAGGYLGYQYLMATGPEPERRPPVDRTPVVEVQQVDPQDYTAVVEASGVVKTRTQTSLVSEVAGRVLEISPNFRPGGYVSEREVLVKLDDTNYQDAIRIAKANILANEAALEQLDQEERNVYANMKLARTSLATVQKNLQVAQANMNNVRRKQAPIQKNADLIQRNLNLVRQNMAITRRNLELAKRDLGSLSQEDLQLARSDLALARKNLGLAQKEMARVRELGQRRLIPLNQVDAQEQAVTQQQQAVAQKQLTISQKQQGISQKQQQILQLEQSLVQQQQAIVQQEQQLAQQDSSEATQDQSVLQHQQTILQQEQAVNQQQQNVTSLQGQLATFASRRKSLQASNDLTRTQLLQQQRNLERTEIRAPYAGRVLEQRVDVGQYLSPNAVLGILYATDYVEVDLPLTLEQYALLDIPEAFRGDEPAPERFPKVEFRLPFGKGPTWSGRITGTRASLNEQSRQINVVARIDRPFERTESGPDTALKIGQYLNARIDGRTFRDVYVLPPVAVRQNRETLLMRDGQVAIVPLEVVWSTETELVSRTAAPLDAPVIVTSLGQATEGMRVSLPGQKPDAGREGRPGGQSGAAGQQPAPAGSVPDTEKASLRDTPEAGNGEGVDTDSTDTGPAGGDTPAVSARPDQTDAPASREN